MINPFTEYGVRDAKHQQIPLIPASTPEPHPGDAFSIKWAINGNRGQRDSVTPTQQPESFYSTVEKCYVPVDPVNMLVSIDSYVIQWVNAHGIFRCHRYDNTGHGYGYIRRVELIVYPRDT